MPNNVINKIKLPNAEVYDIQDTNALPKTTTINNVSKAQDANTYTLTGNDIDISSSYNPPSSGTYSAPAIGDALEEAIGKLAYGVSQATTGGITSVDEAQNSHLDITTSNSTVTVDVATGYVIPPDTVQASASGGSTLTLVSTGDKYTWDEKQAGITMDVGATPVNTRIADSNKNTKLIGGTNVTLTPDTTNGTITFSATDTTYSTFDASNAGLVPAGGSTDGFLKNDGTWATPTDTTYSVFDTSNDGLVPAANGTGETAMFLKGDGTWATPPGTTYTAGTGIDITSGDVINNTGVTSVTASDASTGTNGTILVSTAGATGVEVPVKGLNNAAYKDVDVTITTSTQSVNLPTSAAVDTYVQNAIAGITGPMIFKGAVTINADRSITVPSTVTSIKQGYTFKITELNVSYTGTLKVGDTLIADKDNPTVTGLWVEDTDWTVVPSGDEEAATYPKFEFITDYVYTRVATATTWAANTYYSRSGDTYTLTTSEPTDWDTDYYSYYTKSSATGSFIGIAYSAS